MTNYRRPRIFVFTAAGLAALSIFLVALLAIPGWYLRIIRLTEWYAMAALVSLYVTLLIAPFSFTFRAFPFRIQLFVARRAFGLSSFGFAVIHGCFAFFGQLGGFAGLAFLSGRYLPAVVVGFICSGILATLAATASDRIQKRLGFKTWKILHRFVYAAGVLLIVHVLLVGTHFSSLDSPVALVSFAAMSFLMTLEAGRMDAWLSKGLKEIGRPVSVLVATAIVLYLTLLLSGSFPKPGAHENHSAGDPAASHDRQRIADFNMEPNR